MDWLKKHWATSTGLFLSGLYIYLQLLEWKRHGDDLMLTAVSILVTVVLWTILIAAAVTIGDRDRATSQAAAYLHPRGFVFLLRIRR